MRTSRVTFLVLASVLFAQGCTTTSTPTQRWAVARESLTRTQNIVLEAHKVGQISDEQLIAADDLVKSARRALSRAETDLPEGGGEFENLLQLAQDISTALLQADRNRTRKAIESFKAGVPPPPPVENLSPPPDSVEERTDP